MCSPLEKRRVGCATNLFLPSLSQPLHWEWFPGQSPACSRRLQLRCPSVIVGCRSMKRCIQVNLQSRISLAEASFVLRAELAAVTGSRSSSYLESSED